MVFSNVEQLRMLNEELLTSLAGVEELPVQRQNVGRRFVRFVDFLKMYFEYCANQAAAIERLHELKKGKPNLLQALEVSALMGLSLSLPPLPLPALTHSSSLIHAGDQEQARV